MDMNRLTQKSQEALHDAQTKALRFGHNEIDGEHLLLALLDQPDGLAPRLLAQAGANPDRLRGQVEAEVSRRPRVTGPGAAPGQMLVYPGGFSEMEILFPYGQTCFASKAGQLAGNHFATVVEGREHLPEIGQRVLWEGAQPIRFIER